MLLAILLEGQRYLVDTMFEAAAVSSIVLDRWIESNGTDPESHT
jgi:hypothetical protein